MSCVSEFKLLILLDNSRAGGTIVALKVFKNSRWEWG
jgi:hypothetical protein